MKKSVRIDIKHKRKEGNLGRRIDDEHGSLGVGQGISPELIEITQNSVEPEPKPEVPEPSPIKIPFTGFLDRNKAAWWTAAAGIVIASVIAIIFQLYLLVNPGPSQTLNTALPPETIDKVESLQLDGSKNAIFNGEVVVNNDVTIDGGLYAKQLISCDSIDTDESGRFVCGEDQASAGAGTVGPAGTDGEDGVNGVDGEDGATGPAGTAGNCSNGPECVSLQGTSPGTPETGNINITGDVVAGSFSGDGSALSNLDAGNILSGTLSDARLSSSVTLQGNTFNGASQLVQLNGSTQLPAVSGILLTNLNASNIASGTLDDGRLSANVSLLGASIQDAEADDDLTISSSGSVDWVALMNYPTGCIAGEAVTSVGDTLTCGAFATASSVTLQGGYDNSSSPATILLADAKDLKVSLANTATDPNFLVDIATGSTGKFAVQANGSDVFYVTSSTINLQTDTVLAADKSLKFTGGIAFPGSPTEGQVFFRTDTKQLYIYANAKWQADRSVATKIVAASDSQNAEKADYAAAGSSSDEDAINAAISALPSTGGSVYMLEGTFTVDGSISVPSNVSLIGSGPSTIIKLKNSINANIDAIVATGSTPRSNILLANFKLDGNKANNSSGTQNAISFSAVGSSSLPGAKIQSLIVQSFRSAGISLAGSSVNNFINGNTLLSNSGNGIILSNTGGSGNNQNIISNNTVATSGTVGIYINAGTENMVSGNVVKTSSNNGIYFEGNDNTASGNTVMNSTANGITSTGLRSNVSGNTVRSSGVFGIYVSGNNSQVTGNTVSSSTNYSIYVQFQGGSVTGNAITGGPTGIRVGSVNSTISGNAVNAATTTGIYLESGTSGNLITGNQLSNNGGSGANDSIRVDGSDSNTISSNDITDTAGTGHAINIINSTSDNNLLASNRYSGTGATTINDSGTGTIYNAQLLGSDLVLQAAGNVGIGDTTPTEAKLVVGGDLYVNTIATANSERLCWDGSGGSLITDCTGTPGDYAEYYGTSDVSIEAGDIVAVDNSRQAVEVFKDGEAGSKAWIVKTAESYQSNAIGVVSTNPNEVIGENFEPSENPRPVALNGRVPVKVNTHNGPIKPGDYITSSTVPGVGMKATGLGRVVGIAMSGFSGEGTGMVIIFVNPGYGQSSGEVVQTGSGSFVDLNVSGTANINDLDVAGTFLAADLVVTGHIIGNEDTRGEVTINEGSSSAEFIFDEPYGEVPYVVASPVNRLVLYRVEATKEGFTIYMEGPAAADTKFNYFVQQ